MDIEYAIALMEVEPCSDNGCDYCNDPIGSSFKRVDEFEWLNQDVERNVRSINTGSECWDSKYDNDVTEPITGVQRVDHYTICESCILKYATNLKKMLDSSIGSPISWYNTYMNELNTERKLREQMNTQYVGTSINHEECL